MSYQYADRKRAESNIAEKADAAPAQPSLEALRSGAAAPTQEQLGRRVDLPEAMREKMEASFGTDLSAVKLYESEAVGDAGAEAVTRGSNIAFAPGMLDFTSFGGQSLLGHEISHVVSQSRGEVTGGGFLNDHALEARADREGAMAAAGETVSMPTAAMSGVTAASASGPMQAKKSVAKTDRLASKDYAKTAKYMTKAKEHYEKGNDFRSNFYNNMANRKFKWAQYWFNQGEDPERRQMAADWSGSEVRDKLPIFYKDYYQTPEVFNPRNTEDYSEGIANAQEESYKRHRNGGYY